MVLSSPPCRSRQSRYPRPRTECSKLPCAIAADRPASRLNLRHCKRSPAPTLVLARGRAPSNVHRACKRDGSSPGIMDSCLLSHASISIREFRTRQVLQNISVGDHALQSDEPGVSGGKDAAPDPHELLLASLGACTSITLRCMLQGRDGLSEGMHVNLSWSSEGIEMEISFVGDLSEDQRQRLLEIANRCPIHRVLRSPVSMVGTRSDKAMNRS